MDVQTYTELPVHPGLSDRVVCAWVNPSAHQSRAILPDACMDIFWDGTTLFVAGPDTSPADIDLGVTYVGVRFRPGAAAGFIEVAADEVRNRRIPLAEFWGREADELAERLAESAGEAIDTLQRALLTRRTSAPIDPLLGHVLKALAPGDCDEPSINALARHLSVDGRTLRRRCVRGFGYGPKTLARILRFRRAVLLGRAGNSIADAAMTAGYADQAHLARECRRLAGVTPGTLFADPSVIVSISD